SLPPFPATLKPIGPAFEIRTSTPLARYVDGSITFQYLGRDVQALPLPEESLAVHYWNGSTWQRLETVLNTLQNFASAPLPGPGLYMLTMGTVVPQIRSLSPISGSSNLSHTLTIMGNDFLQPVSITLTAA